MAPPLQDDGNEVQEKKLRCLLVENLNYLWCTGIEQMATTCQELRDNLKLIVNVYGNGLKRKMILTLCVREPAIDGMIRSKYHNLFKQL